ncbi:MAG: hypothetical protein M3044_20975 [Thermoproteota archaeon]|nr:hypothetical protein [Thermoproteota archaeon]
MQSGKEHREDIATTSSTLFAVITAAVIAVLAVPVIIPHIGRTGLIYHILVQIVNVIVTVFLTVVSIIAYRRNGSGRLLFMMGGFAVLAVVEFLYLFYA